MGNIRDMQPLIPTRHHIPVIPPAKITPISNAVANKASVARRTPGLTYLRKYVHTNLPMANNINAPM